MSKNSRRKHEKPRSDAYVDLVIPLQQTTAANDGTERSNETPPPFTASGESLDDFVARQAGSR